MDIHLHPDDLIFFNEVADAMRRVAKHYALPLRSVTALKMPKKGMADRLGDCSITGDIRLVLRCTEDGEWCVHPMSPGEVWTTAAHELSHLRHWKHGREHGLFEEELLESLKGQQKDHREKVIDKLVKIQALRQSEAEMGNTAAAEAFAATINRMLLENELSPSDLDYARATDKDPVIEVLVDLAKYRIEKKKSRIAWQESLARVVAYGNLCTHLIRPGSNHIWFVGTKSHALVAEYAYGILVPAAEKMCTTEYFRYYSHCRFQLGDLSKTHGFKAAWLDAFVGRIAERLKEAREAAVKQAATDVPGGQQTALVRLNGALVKVQKYIDNRFKGKKGVNGLGASSRKAHMDARNMGRAAADKMVIGRRALTQSAAPPRLLSDGK